MTFTNEELLKKTNVVVNAYSNKHSKYIPIVFTYYGINLIRDDSSETEDDIEPFKNERGKNNKNS